ncbi:hypothetical protein [Roseobacter litoralis]|uniref:hypothetical protein n=1 Tax=Roseobacter litoralis TaxID=42443 RepID=UPI0024944B99|nr:hypothetical protein [Roseobacter litoralis]
MVEFYRGDSLAIRLSFIAAGSPVDITGITITSQLRDARGALISDLDVTIKDAAAGVVVVGLGSSETADFPLGSALSNLTFTDAFGNKFSTEPFVLKIMESITRA